MWTSLSSLKKNDEKLIIEIDQNQQPPGRFNRNGYLCRQKKRDLFQINFMCHPCAGAMLIFSVF